MSNVELPATVVAEDQELEGSAERTREALARHRWHWTLDESNPDRVGVREYARSVGRSAPTIADMVNGYSAWIVRGAPDTDLADELERAKLRGDRLIATEAVAKAAGVSLGTARRHKGNEVREVQAAAQERALRNDTTVADEVEHVVEWRQKVAKTRTESEAERRARHTLRYHEVEGDIASAKRYLAHALKVTEGVEFTAEEREFIADSVGNLKALLGLIDMRISGAVNVDWDAEMAKLGSTE